MNENMGTCKKQKGIPGINSFTSLVLVRQFRKQSETDVNMRSAISNFPEIVH